MENEKKTILAIGAHYEECEYCCGGLIANYTKEGHRVVIVHVAGDFSNWPKEKANETVRQSHEAAELLGAKQILLPFKTGCIPLNYEPQRMIAEIVKEYSPDVALIHWPLDYHPDHIITSFVSYHALKSVNGFLDTTDIRGPREIYAFEQRPGQTMYFEPDTLVDVTDTVDLAAESMRKFTALGGGEKNYAEEMYALKRIRGFLAGVKYAEAYKNVSFWPLRFPKKILGL